MDQIIKVSDEVYVGSQPNDDELKELAEEDFGTVVNLRSYDEEDQPLSPGDEGVRVRQLGMEYLSIPVTPDDMTTYRVDDFRTKLGLLAKPVFVHCKNGKRSGAFAMMDRAVRDGWSGEETLQKAEELGFACDVPAIKQFVKSYVDGKAG